MYHYVTFYPKFIPKNAGVKLLDEKVSLVASGTIKVLWHCVTPINM